MNRKQKFILFSGLFALLLWFSLSNTEHFDNKVRVENDIITSKIVARGEVAPEQVVNILSKIKTLRVQVSWLIEEGSRVQKGDLIATFNEQPLIEKLQQKLSDRNRLSIELSEAEQLAKISKTELESKIISAKSQFEATKIEAESTLNNEGFLALEKMKIDLNDAEAALTEEEVNLTDLAQLVEEGHISQRELAREQKKHQQNKEKFKLAKKQLAYFNQYSLPLIKIQTQSKLASAETEYNKSVALQKLEITRAERKVEKLKGQLEQLDNIVETLNSEIANCRILAPVDGPVLYHRVRDNNQWRKIQLGDSVYFNKSVLQIPTDEQLIINAQIEEFEVNKLAVGQPIEFVLDSQHDRLLHGKVANINIIPIKTEQQNLYQFISTLDDTQGLFIGMQGMVSIKASTLQRVKVLPLQAVSKLDDQYVVYTTPSKDSAPVPVELGFIGSGLVEVRSELLTESDWVYF